MSHVSDRIVLNDAGTVKDIHPELAADFLCTQGRGRSCNINSPTCDSPSSCNMPCKEKTHARRSANAAVSCTMVRWLGVRNSATTVDFYRSAFGTTDVN